MPKKDWAREWAERLVANGRPVGRYFMTEDEEDDEKRIAAALRRAYKKGQKDATPLPSPGGFYDGRRM